MPQKTYYDRIYFEGLAGLTVPIIQRRMMMLAQQVLSTWKAEAAGVLNTTLNDYLAALSITEFDGTSFKVVLKGTVPNMLEQGMGPGGVGTYGRYDLRQFILKDGTRSLRRAKDGRLYVNIPFRHGTAALGESGYGEQASKLKASIQPEGESWRPPNSNLVDPSAKQAKVFHMRDGKLMPGYGGRLGSEAGEKRQWWWHSPHLAGLVRMQKTYSKVAQSHYMTFRRIIQWSPKPGETEQAKWWHPGIRPGRFAEKTMLRMDEMIKAFFGPGA